MVPSVTTVLQRFKTDWAAQLHPDAIHAACQETGYTSWRDRLLNPVITVQLFLLQILHGNTACQHLPHLSGLRFSASAYCQARSKLPLPILAHLLERLGHSAQPALSEEGRWHGHRTFFVDGSGCSMPDTPVLQEEFGQPAEQQPGCGFPVAHLLALFHAGTGLLTQRVVAPLNTHDLARVREVHSALQSGDVLVADRGLCSYAHLALLAQAGLHALLRVQARQIVDFTPSRPFVMPGTRRTPEIKGLPRSRWIKAHGKHDQQVEWFKPKTCPPWLDQETFKTLPLALVVREIRYQVSAPGFRTQPITVVTTLVDVERYPCADVAALYHQRWEAETHLGQLKTTMKMDVLHCKTVLGVLKELTVFAIVYNLVRLVILQSAQHQQVEVDRISFLDALRWLGAPDSGVPLEGLYINSSRPHRVEPRVKKRRPKKFPFMSKPRHVLRKYLLQQPLELN
jgi:Transposase DDE domain